jgi:MYXO-CTERM domain-containing protein
MIRLMGLGVLLLLVAARPGSAQSAPPAISIQKNVSVDGKMCDVVTWTDANGRPRTVSLVRAGGDVGGYSGGYVQRYSYYVDGAQKTGRADETQPGVSGLGCAVNHHSGASTSKANSTGATTAFVFEGANHCLWRFRSTYSGDGHTVGLTLDWLISNGRNDLLWAVSYDATGQSSFDWDARGPYFQFDWDGDGQFYNGAISGIRWGDRYRFRTTSYNGVNSSWDYTQLSPAPYMMLYKDAGLGNVEAGVVQTQTWAQQDAGGYWWAGSHWGQTGTGMMENWNCPFQLNAYEGYAGEKMAWGTPFGFVGNPAYQRVDFATVSAGAPHQGYSTWIILNKHSDGLTDAMINGVGAVQQTTITATTGSVVLSGPRHANLSGNANYQPAGWNHVYGAWAIDAASNAAAFNVGVASGSLVRPMFQIRGYTAATPPATLSLGGTALTAGTDYSASVDAAGQTLWITLHRNLSGATNAIDVGGAPGAPPPPPPPPGPAPAPGPAPSGGDDGGSDKKCGCGTAISPHPAMLAALAVLGTLAVLRRR